MPDDEPITEQMALAALHTVIDGHEDYVYTPPEGDWCRYEYNGQPSCVIGKTLAVLGYSVAEIAVLDVCGPNGRSVGAKHIPIRAANGQAPEIFTRISPVAANLFDLVQRRQDTKMSWGMALDRAEYPEFSD